MLYIKLFMLLKKYNPVFTGCIDAGANPRMITHFSILGIFNMAKYAIEQNIDDYKKSEILWNIIKKKIFLD